MLNKTEFDFNIRDKPGAHERHLLRRHKNILFGEREIHVTSDSLQRVQKIDHDILERFNNDFRELVTSVVALKETEDSIRASLNHSLSSKELSSKIQYSTIDIINDRYVIPIKSDSYSNSMGMIIHRSDSGNTLYVEPKNVAKLNTITSRSAGTFFECAFLLYINLAQLRAISFPTIR